MLQLLIDGCYLLVIGMGTVFIFLTVMIWVMELGAKTISIVNKYFPEEVVEDKHTSKKKAANNDAEIALAIACALNKGGAKC